MKSQSTIYPTETLILGNKVYVRDLTSVTEKTDEQGNTVYEYDEIVFNKDEYIEKIQTDVKSLEAEIDAIFGSE